jgi:diacylglycerol kinase (ATP)
MFCEDSNSFGSVLSVSLILQLLAWFSMTDTSHWVMVMFMTSISPVAEIFNSAIETTVDRISLDYHELSKTAKDMAAAASMWTQIVTIGCSVSMIYCDLQKG